jgi:hypothetical protein
MAAVDDILEFPSTPAVDTDRYFLQLLADVPATIRAEWSEWDKVPYNPDHHEVELLNEEHERRREWEEELEALQQQHEQRVEHHCELMMWNAPDEHWWGLEDNPFYNDLDDYPWDDDDIRHEFVDDDPFGVEAMITREEDEEDELLEALAIAQSGGPKGWRARHVVQI